MVSLLDDGNTDTVDIVVLTTSFPGNSNVVEVISKGNIMLFSNLVLFATSTT